MAGDRGNANVKGTDVELAFPSRSPGGSGERTAPARERGPWWQIWRSRGRWQELATHEKEQILPTDRPPGTRNIFTLLLVASVSINVILLLVLLGLAVTGNLYIKRVKGGNLLGSWAVDEASTVVNAAMVSCSGKGLRFADSIGGGCECNQCYEGPNCSQLTLNCTLDLSSGTPTLFEDYWASNLEASAAFIPGTYRLGYADGNLDGLEAAVRKLHDTVGNVKSEGKQLILGAGSTSLIFGLLHAISAVNRENGFEGKTAVTSAPPYYNLYSFGARMEQSDLFEWKPYADVSATSAPSINFVVSPNNPDGRAGDPELGGASVSVHDFAYYWPHFAPITAPADYDVMLFTLSKVSGHAGSRVGWVWVKDAHVADVLRLYMSVHTITMSHESQYRAIKILNAITDGYEREGARTATLTRLTPNAAAAQGRIFHFAKLVMQNRWDRLHAVLGTTGTDSKTRITIQPVPPAAECGFFRQVVNPSPAYAYLHCTRPKDGDCYALLNKGRIVGRPGVVFGDEPSYVRLSLLGRESDFALALERLEALVSAR